MAPDPVCGADGLGLYRWTPRARGPLRRFLAEFAGACPDREPGCRSVGVYALGATRTTWILLTRHLRVVGGSALGGKDARPAVSGGGRRRLGSASRAGPRRAYGAVSGGA